MIVPFSAADFLDRALAVYADRAGIVDEPDQPAESLGDLTYARVGELARAQAAKLDGLGIGVGDRVAYVSHNSARLFTAFFGVAGHGLGQGGRAERSDHGLARDGRRGLGWRAVRPRRRAPR